MLLFPSAPAFVWSANADGLAIRFASSKQHARAKQGQADEATQLGLIRMDMLAESGQAEVRNVDAGIFVASVDAVRLDLPTREGFLLPPPWPGGLRLRTESVPQSPAFAVRLGLVDPGAEVRWEWKLRGPILETAAENYLPTAAQYAALRAFQNWREAAGAHDELANLSLLATLREAREAGCRIDLEAYDQTLIANARELSVDARLEDGTGDLLLRPVVAGDFPALSADEVEARYGQLAGGKPQAVLRVGKTIVLLDPEQTRQARALAGRGRVPRAQTASFRSDPAAWLAEHVFPDIESEFSPRVTGIGAWQPAYLGAMWGEGEDWFGKKPQPEKSAGSGGAAGTATGEQPGTESSNGPEENPAEPMVPIILANDQKLEFGPRAPEKDPGGAEPDFSRYARAPLLHQREAVTWLLGHGRRALRQRVPPDGEAARCFGAGALLADDMGLGKTFSTLIFLREWFDLWRTKVGGEPPAVLIVAPLSLLGNWKAEIAKSYGEANAVFRRVLIAQSDEELNFVRRRPGSRDKAVPGAVLEYGLGFGDGTERSLDYPGGCVLTTYQCLRDYRFSFAKADWSAAIFDEAQNIKNPNALQTIAAKSLKALFRLTLTGTPVENHLGDFWSILDASEPGPLGSFAEFRQKWIVPMTRERERQAEIGRLLRDEVNGLMLRRMKEEASIDLPEKSGHHRSIPVEMTPEQLAAYDAVVASVQGEPVSADDSGSARQNRQLAALWQLRQISLHPDLLAGGSIGAADNTREARALLQRSGKLAWLMRCLDEIRARGEKTLVFCVQKKLQEALARHLSLIYGVPVPVINGDTKAASRRDPEETRLGLIEQFSTRAGFGVCLLSPIAAGAGLNIVAANHVIHLERHWNPAKEDQATDRAYRIGQDRPVFVYLPAVQHPDPARRSFDDVLHRLIERKRGLQGALGLVPPPSVTDAELIDEVLATGDSTPGQHIDLAAALRLPWRLFEALVAVLYERDARRVILTPGGNDHGCDVVVLDAGASRGNLLVQCKATARDELDSEAAVREVEGARPYYENKLGVTFQGRCLHTNAKRLTKRTRHAAEVCGVTVHDHAWLAAELRRATITLPALLARDARRERV